MEVEFNILDNDSPSSGGEQESSPTLTETIWASTVQDALSYWTTTLGVTNPPTILTSVVDLGPDVLADTVVHMQDSRGLPSVVTIRADIDAAGHSWFIDNTPREHSEFSAGDNPWLVDLKEGSQRFDLWTIALHEVGHSLGLISDATAYGNRVLQDELGPYLSVGGTRIRLDDDVDHLSSQYPSALMGTHLRPGQRNLGSPVDLQVLRWIQNVGLGDWSSGNGQPANGNSTPAQPQTLPGFQPLASFVSDALRIGPKTGLQDARFTSLDLNVPTGWRTFGDVSAANGIVTLSESAQMVSDLSQTFVVPSGARRLSFTLTGIQMEVDGGIGPSDAFEVSLLNAMTSTTLVGNNALHDSDSLLSLQADGTLRLAPKVSVNGYTQGQVVDFNKPLVVNIDISSVPAGSTASLYFDLIGFGKDESSVSIRDLKIARAFSDWHNATIAADVNEDGEVTPLDAILIVDELIGFRIASADRVLPPITDAILPPPFVDVSDDGMVTPLDALLVIDRILKLRSVPNLTGDTPANQLGPLPGSWQNPVLSGDVNNDSQVSPLDALILIEEMNRKAIVDPLTNRLPAVAAQLRPSPYLDVNGDGYLSAVDVLLAIDQIESDPLAANSEGESGQATDIGNHDESDAFLDLLASDWLDNR